MKQIPLEELQRPKKQLFMEELLRQKKSYIAEVGLREYECLWDLVTGSPPYVKTWKELKEYLGTLTPQAQQLMDVDAGFL